MNLLKLLSIGAVLGALTPQALACSCMRFETAEAQLAIADLAFEGQVINVAPERDRRPFWQRWLRERPVTRYVTTFQVYWSLKGDAGNTVALTHLGGENSAACGLDFEQTDPFIVLAYRNTDGSFGSSLCTQAQFSTAAFLEASINTLGE